MTMSWSPMAAMRCPLSSVTMMSLWQSSNSLVPATTTLWFSSDLMTSANAAKEPMSSHLQSSWMAWTSLAFSITA